MELFVNQQLIDMELQQEKTAGEVAQAMARWLKQNGCAILEIKVNGLTCSPLAPEWQHMPLTEVATMEIEAPLLRELRQANLEVLLEYLLQVQELLQGLQDGTRQPADFAVYAASLPEITPSAAFLAANHERYGSSLEQGLMESVSQDIRSAASQAGSSFVLPEQLPTHLGYLILLCQDRLKEALHPLQEARATCQALETSLEDLAMVSTKLMTGDERGAFDAVMRFSELLSRLLRIYWIILEEGGPGEQPPFAREALETHSTRANATLAQISTAIEAEDTVMLGDLLEYELPEQVRNLTGLMGQ